ncbi:protein phosphatase 1 regulatory subunit 3G [Kryptolebias marmoratus]|uniref:protein phosphatase 1 regulatory subunit 3G n=1 Tax=Kryptolebias marmoratus TaxID=37003 RepID=UPI0007F8CBD8|nr:protein phosphatase 1 regulatory subunit 3G [Kryptolebias marmoratus]
MSRSPPPFRAGEDPGPVRSVQNGLQDEDEDDEDDEEEEDLDDELDASHLERFMRDRRRARSLPAYPAALLDADSDSGRKRVTFADSLGLTLTSVKHFSSQEEPQIPSKVLSRHKSFPPQQDLNDLCQNLRSALDTDRLVACFPELRDPDQRVLDLRVCLEKLHITQFEFRGQIRVLRGLGVREVGVRYTFNGWLSHVDAQALPVPVPVPVPGEDPAGSEEERFGFTVYTPPFMDPSSAVDFAVFLRSDQGEFWDNNQGRNYTLRYRSLPDRSAFISNAFSAT